VWDPIPLSLRPELANHSNCSRARAPGTGVSTDSNDSAKADSIDIMRALSEDRPEA